MRCYWLVSQLSPPTRVCIDFCGKMRKDWGQKICHNKLSNPRMFDCIRTSYQLAISVFRIYQRTKAPKTLKTILTLVRWQCCIIGFPAELFSATRALENISWSGLRFCGSSNRAIGSRADRLPWYGTALNGRRCQWPGRGQLNLVPGGEWRSADLDTLDLIHAVGSGFPGFMLDGTKQQIPVLATA